MLETISLFLHETVVGKFIFTLLFSMLPVIELRGGIPLGVSMGLGVPTAFTAAFIGNMIPVPFIILFVRRVFQWIRKNISFLGGIIEKLERRADEKKDVVLKYEFWGLLILVAIPLPGTGAWTGALVAAVLDMRLKKAMPAITLGVIIAGLIITAVTYGAVRIFF